MKKSYKEKTLNDVLDLWRSRSAEFSLQIDFSREDSCIFMVLRDKKTEEIVFNTVCRNYDAVIRHMEKFLNASESIPTDWKDAHFPKEYRDGPGY